jgi:serine/threonine protein kinase
MTAGLRQDDEAGRASAGLGEWVGPYRLMEQLGEGGMGVVYLALARSGRAVAIKVLREHIAHDPDARSRLAREVQTLARVQDARVAAVLDADTEGPRPYIVTRYVPGPALDRFVSENGPLRGQALLRLGGGLSDALHAIHGVGVIHRDLKPANVLLLDGDPVVIDFGIAHVADDIRLTMTGLVMGTPGYLSPEVVEGATVTEATDWWGWAATLAFAASGVPPFGRGPMDVVLDRVRRGQADLSGVDPDLAPLLQAALSPDPSLRPHADEIVNALDRYAAGAPSTVAVPAVDPRPRTQRQPVVSQTQALDQGNLAAREQSRPRSAQPDPSQQAGWPGAWVGGPDNENPQNPSDPGGYGETAGAEEPEEAQEAEDPRIGRPARVGTLLAMTLGVLGVAAVWPVVAVGLIVLWTWSARFADRLVTSLVVRRHRSGRRRRDVPLAVVATPWHVLVAAVASVIALLLPVVVGIAATFSAALVVGAITGGDPQANTSMTVVVGSAFGLLMSWWGPGGASLRRGSRSLVRGLSPGRAVSTIAVAVFVLLGAGLGVWAWRHHGELNWWPWVSGQLPPVSRLFG